MGTKAIVEHEHQEARLITWPMVDTEKGFVKDLDSYLSHRGTLELRKKELLHMRWTERVWMPIQKNIRDHHLLCQGKEAEKMRSAVLHYLEHCNTKGFVSLESYDPNEYDPFLHLISGPRYFKVSTPSLKDPLLLQSRDRTREMRTVLHCQTGNRGFAKMQQKEMVLDPSVLAQEISDARDELHYKIAVCGASPYICAILSRCMSPFTLIKDGQISTCSHYTSKNKNLSKPQPIQEASYYPGHSMLHPTSNTIIFRGPSSEAGGTLLYLFGLLLLGVQAAKLVEPYCIC
ncbi:protein FAM228A isoform X2 [Anguilla rostrata]|uniref:protein FAM228A isoform X2 n=1 Tax=Anguilla rostrata TaxID=7938 RepID=UPI0030CFB25B